MTEKVEKPEITGKQVLSDCVTLFKHLCAYTVCVTKRVCRKVKCIADKNKDKKSDDKKVDDTSE